MAAAMAEDAEDAEQNRPLRVLYTGVAPFQPSRSCGLLKSKIITPALLLTTACCRAICAASCPADYSELFWELFCEFFGYWYSQIMFSEFSDRECISIEIRVFSAWLTLEKYFFDLESDFWIFRKIIIFLQNFLC